MSDLIGRAFDGIRWPRGALAEVNRSKRLERVAKDIKAEKKVKKMEKKKGIVS